MATVMILAVTPLLAVAGERPLVQLRGSELKPGAPTAIAGGIYKGVIGVNAVYAVPTGQQSDMQATFQLAAVFARCTSMVVKMIHLRR